MSKYDFAIRLKRIVHAECEIVKAESNIAQKSAKYCEKMSATKTTLVKQEQELNKYRKHVQNLIHENEKLRKLKQEQEYKLTVLLQNAEQLEVEYNKVLQMQIEQNQSALLQMDCFRNIKLAAQTYINLKALPHLIQGVTVNETDCSSQWNPFSIEPLHYTQKEVEDIIWHDPHNDSELKKTWETLILGDNISDTCKFREVGKSNGSKAPVVV